MQREDYRTNNKKLTFERLFDDGGAIAIALDRQTAQDIDGLIVDTSVCDNPECACREIRLSIHGASRNGNRMARPPKTSPFAQVAFDVDTQTLRKEESPGPSGPEAAHLFDLLEKHIGPYRKVLTQRFHRARSRQDDGEWRSRFLSNFEEGLMVGFYEIFPDWFDMGITDGDTRYWIYDHWCVEPKCKCKEAVLSVLSDESFKDMTGVYVDTRRWKGAAGQPDTPEKRIVERFLSRPENKKEMMRHEQQIKTVKAFLAAERARVAVMSNANATVGRRIETASSRKVGRNDRCPCGSGKKYKLCCGR